MSDEIQSIGTVFIAHRAIATIAHQSAMESYGVVGLAAKNLAEGISQVLVKDPTLGVDVQFDGQSVKIDLYIIVEYGTRVKMVASSVADNVRYKIEQTTGLKVSQVDVHVRGLRISNAD